MPQRIFFSALAIAQLRNLDRTTAMRTLIALTRLLETGEGDVKALQGTGQTELRLRVGDYRVRYRTAGTMIHVHCVAHRRDVYR